MATACPMELDTVFEDPWPASAWEAIAARAAAATQAVAPELTNPRLSTDVLFTSDEEVHTLNRQWRQRDKPTNVLSFPMLARAELLSLDLDGPPVLLGDVALACETCTREADERCVTLEDHATHLIVHGLLHLAGYDHDRSPAEAEAMEALETKALAICGIADPYGDRAS